MEGRGRKGREQGRVRVERRAAEGGRGGDMRRKARKKGKGGRWLGETHAGKVGERQGMWQG